MNRVFQRLIVLAANSQKTRKSLLSRLPPRVLYNLSQQFTSKIKDEYTEKVDAEKKKKKQIPRITLISDGDKIEITTLEEAQKLGLRRNLKLVKVIDLDTKTQRPVYKLMSGAEYFAEDLKQREEKKLKKDFIKGEKLLNIGAKIASHDLIAKLKLVQKWVQKSYEVRVIITKDGGEVNKMEQIAKEIEKVAGQDGRVVQKRNSSVDVRLSILPVKKTDIVSDSPSGVSNQQTSPLIKSYHTDS